MSKKYITNMRLLKFLSTNKYDNSKGSVVEFFSLLHQTNE